MVDGTENSVISCMEDLRRCVEDVTPRCFTAIVSNPPYQRELTVSGGDSKVTNVFHLFQEVANVVSPLSSMIYPGGRWLHGTGRGLKEFSYTALNNSTLRQILYYSEAETIQHIFPETNIRDGVSVVLYDGVTVADLSNKHGFLLNGVKTTPKAGLIPIGPPELLSLVEKVSSWPTVEEKITTYNKRVKLSVNKAVDDPRIVLYREGEELPAGWVKILINDVYGPSGRTKLFMAPEDVISTGIENLPLWKIHMGTLQGREKPGDFRFKLADDVTVLSPSRLLFAAVPSREEAVNLQKYLCSKTAQLLLTPAVKSRNSSGKGMASFLPDLGVYTSESTMIEWSEPLDEQLYGLFNFTFAEREYVEKFSRLVEITS